MQLTTYEQAIHCMLAKLYICSIEITALGHRKTYLVLLFREKKTHTQLHSPLRAFAAALGMINLRMQHE